jgi:hypothetical protein
MALRAQIDTNTVIVGDLNTPLSPIDRQKISKETSELLYTLGQIDMVYIYRVFHPKAGNTHYFLHLMELSLR